MRKCLLGDLPCGYGRLSVNASAASFRAGRIENLMDEIISMYGCLYCLTSRRAYLYMHIEPLYVG